MLDGFTLKLFAIQIPEMAIQMEPFIFNIFLFVGGKVYPWMSKKRNFVSWLNKNWFAVKRKASLILPINFYSGSKKLNWLFAKFKATNWDHYIFWKRRSHQVSFSHLKFNLAFCYPQHKFCGCVNLNSIVNVFFFPFFFCGQKVAIQFEWLVINFNIFGY